MRFFTGKITVTLVTHQTAIMAPAAGASRCAKTVACNVRFCRYMKANCTNM